METAAPFILVALLAWLWQRRRDRRLADDFIASLEECEREFRARETLTVDELKKEVLGTAPGAQRRERGTDPGADFKWGGSS